MTTVMPEGDAIRKAIKWISEELREKPVSSIKKLINEATLRFDLSPKDTDFLMQFYEDSEEHESKQRSEDE